ncbi:MAG: hypothetical protein FWG82_06950 [Oscillospiraceae bacterium]|nr:hypothetical protein [Oscillospiraceae bacterium]
MSEEKNEEEKIILPKTLQAEMMKFFFEVAVRQKKQEQLEALLSKSNDRSKE